VKTISRFQNASEKSLLIVCSDAIYLKGLLITLLDSFSVVKTTDNVHEAISEIEKLRPDVVLIEMNSKSESDTYLLKEVCRLIASNRLILINTDDSDVSEQLVGELVVGHCISKFDELNKLYDIINSIIE
jgi:chemotaxis response regulator CheB